nr:hypothetical protein [Tanacetum cinerariifolium]
MNEDYYHEQNSCYNSNSFGFDACQPPQYIVNHPIFNTHHDYLDSQKELSTTITKLKEQMTSLTSFCEIACQIIQKKHEEKRIKEEQAAKAQNRKLPVCYNDDDDEEESNSLKDNIIFELPPCSAVTPSEPIDSLKSMLNRDSFVISHSSKIDSLLYEFAGELTPLKTISLGIDKADCHPKNEIRFPERLLYDNSSPRPPEEFVFENSNAEIESFSPSSIPIEDSDSHMEEIDLSFNPDDTMPPNIEDDDNDSEGDNLFLERLLHDDPIPLPDTLDFSNVVRVFLPFFTYPVTSSLFLSSGSEDTIFDLGISNYHFSSFKPDLSHRCGTFKKFNTMKVRWRYCFPLAPPWTNEFGVESGSRLG